jgi:hypothetical protein
MRTPKDFMTIAEWKAYQKGFTEGKEELIHEIAKNL